MLHKIPSDRGDIFASEMKKPILMLSRNIMHMKSGHIIIKIQRCDGLENCQVRLICSLGGFHKNGSKNSTKIKVCLTKE